MNNLILNIENAYKKYLNTGDMEDLIKYSLISQNYIYKRITKGYKLNNIDNEDLYSLNLEALAIILNIIKERGYDKDKNFKFSSFLYGIHKNRILNLIRDYNKKEINNISLDKFDEVNPDYKDTIINKYTEDDYNYELIQYLKQISKTEEDFRILLMISKGYTIADISKILNIRHNTILMRLKNRYRLKEIYEMLKKK